MNKTVRAHVAADGAAPRRAPEGWCECKIGDLIPRMGAKIAPSRSSKLPFVGMDHIDPGSFRLNGQDEFRRMKSAGSHFFPRDVLYGRLRPYLNKVHTAKFEGASSAEFIVLPASPNHDSDFLRYLLHQRDFVNFASSQSSGDRPRINFDAISQYGFLLPPLNEQSRIASKIDELFSRIEAGEAALDRATALIERYRNSVLKAAVTGELTRDWREKNKGKIEPADKLLERILKAQCAAREKSKLARMRTRVTKPNGDTRANSYASPSLPDASDLPELPKSWLWGTLDMIADVKGGVTVDAKRIPDDPVTLPYLRVANVQRGYLDLTEVKQIVVERAKVSDLLLRDGDILLNEGGDLDKLGRGWVWNGEISPCTHQNHVFRARLFENGCVPELISWYTNTLSSRFFLQEGKQTTNLASISLSKLKQVPVPIIPPNEQREIKRRLDAKLNECEDIATALVRASPRHATLQQSVLKAAFEGRLLPQDPNDEPADVLLARIRAQREAPVHPEKCGPRKRAAKSAVDVHAD